jgi:hypothetical protein
MAVPFTTGMLGEEFAGTAFLSDFTALAIETARLPASGTGFNGKRACNRSAAGRAEASCS